MTKDILLYETGNGGDMLILNNDLSVVEILYQQVYLCLFGGNIESVTKGDELSSEIRNDWWGNSIHLSEKKEKQFNSETEKSLNTVALNSNGRIKIIRAIEDDLKSLKKICNIKVDAQILNNSKLKIMIVLMIPNNKEDKTLQIIWDNARQELIIEKDI
jgi:phage gp46-like protein